VGDDPGTGGAHRRLRETSILFALLISALVLKERIGRRRMLAAALIVAGVVLLRLG